MRKDILRSPSCVAVVRDKKKHTHTKKKRTTTKKDPSFFSRDDFFYRGDQKIKKAEEQKRDKKRQKKENFLLCFLTLERGNHNKKKCPLSLCDVQKKKEEEGTIFKVSARLSLSLHLSVTHARTRAHAQRHCVWCLCGRAPPRSTLFIFPLDEQKEKWGGERH